jgi:hypothetical protein
MKEPDKLFLKPKMPIGILIDKDLQQVKHVFIPLFSPEDSFVIDYIQKISLQQQFKKSLFWMSIGMSTLIL